MVAILGSHLIEVGEGEVVSENIGVVQGDGDDKGVTQKGCIEDCPPYPHSSNWWIDVPR